MESYKIMNDGRIQRQSDLASIPPIEENRDYLKFLEDKKVGAEILPFDYAAEEVRQQREQTKINNEQEREALIQAKIREQAIEALKAEGKLKGLAQPV